VYIFIPYKTSSLIIVKKTKVIAYLSNHEHGDGLSILPSKLLLYKFNHCTIGFQLGGNYGIVLN